MLRHSRQAFILLVLLSVAGICRAEIKCYTNSGNSLYGHKGKDGLTECTSKSECFEAIPEPGSAFGTQVYSAGCTGCPTWSPATGTPNCKKCSTSLCNNEMAKKIQKDHLECYDMEQVSAAKFVGSRVYCSKGEKECNWSSLVDKKGETRFSGSCGKSSIDSATVCSTSRCNLSPELKKAYKGDTKPKKKKKKPAVKDGGAKGGGDEEEADEDGGDDDGKDSGKDGKKGGKKDGKIGGKKEGGKKGDDKENDADDEKSEDSENGATTTVANRVAAVTAAAMLGWMVATICQLV